jgi:hypothetical protein
VAGSDHNNVKHLFPQTEFFEDSVDDLLVKLFTEKFVDRADGFLKFERDELRA